MAGGGEYPSFASHSPQFRTISNPWAFLKNSLWTDLHVSLDDPLDLASMDRVGDFSMGRRC